MSRRRTRTLTSAQELRAAGVQLEGWRAHLVDALERRQRTWGKGPPIDPATTAALARLYRRWAEQRRPHHAIDRTRGAYKATRLSEDA